MRCICTILSDIRPNRYHNQGHFKFFFLSQGFAPHGNVSITWLRHFFWAIEASSQQTSSGNRLQLYQNTNSIGLGALHVCDWKLFVTAHTKWQLRVVDWIQKQSHLPLQLKPKNGLLFVVASFSESGAVPLMQCPCYQKAGTHFADLRRITGRVTHLVIFNDPKILSQPP